VTNKGEQPTARTTSERIFKLKKLAGKVSGTPTIHATPKTPRSTKKVKGMAGNPIGQGNWKTSHHFALMFDSTCLVKNFLKTCIFPATSSVFTASLLKLHWRHRFTFHLQLQP
jgi:hypothetical protein